MGGMPLKLIALVVPLSLDTFAVSAALGIGGLSRRERWRLSLLLAVFEAVMPIVGFVVGALVSRALGEIADYAASAVLVGAGLVMMREGDSEAGEALAGRMRGLTALGVGVSGDRPGNRSSAHAGASRGTADRGSSPSSESARRPAWRPAGRGASGEG
jgi:putative Mn2+ efflux pump MntP